MSLVWMEYFGCFFLAFLCEAHYNFARYAEQDTIFKTLMTATLLQTVESSFLKKKIPTLRSGLTVRVHQRIKEGNKERVQVFEGLIIKLNNGAGVNKTITVRKMVGSVGVEKIFPLHSPNIVKIDIVKEAKVRRAKLYYMRERFGKGARLQERHVSMKDQVFEDEVQSEAGTETVPETEKDTDKEGKS